MIILQREIISYSYIHFTESISFTTLVNCTNVDLVGDGFCDDLTNNMECNYDGGDCCGINIKNQYCSECQCLEETTTTTITTTITTMTTATPTSSTTTSANIVRTKQESWNPPYISHLGWYLGSLWHHFQSPKSKISEICVFRH